jgi:hypothetical protein
MPGYPHEAFIIETKLLILFEFMEIAWRGHSQFPGWTTVNRLAGGARVRLKQKEPVAAGNPGGHLATCTPRYHCCESIRMELDRAGGAPRIIAYE